MEATYLKYVTHATKSYRFIIMENITKQDQLAKGAGFLFEAGNPETTFIPEEKNEDQEMIQNTCREFVQAEIIDQIQKVEKQENDIAGDILEKAGELGLLGSHMPEELGGMNMDTNTNTLICEEMGRGGSFTTTFAAHTGIGMLPILYFGTEEQKQKYLPGLITGELKACYCLTEPGSGSDALAAKSKAELTEDGKHYVLNGQKMWISNAGFADVFIVFAKIDGDKFTGFIVEKDYEGLSLGAEEDKMGIKGSSTRQVFFENMKVPVENLLGEIGKGHLIAFNVLNVGRFKLGVASLGACKSNISIAVNYANERIAFKMPISKFGAIQYKLAEQVIRSYALESTSYRISQQIADKIDDFKSTGLGLAEAKLEAAEEYAIECAIVKVYGSDAMDYIVDETVQIHGGYGFSEEFAAARMYRDSRIARIYEGTNEINRILIMNMLIKRGMAGHLDLQTAIGAAMKKVQSGPTTNGVDGPFAKELNTVNNWKTNLFFALGLLMKGQENGQVNMRQDQEILMNLADILIDIYNAESVMMRLQKMEAKGLDWSVERNIMEVYFFDASSRIRKNLEEALCSFGSEEEVNQWLPVVDRFAKYKPVNVKNGRRAVAKKLIAANTYCF